MTRLPVGRFTSAALAWGLGIALAVLPVLATAAGPVKLLGLEDMSCDGWKAAADREVREPYVQWVRGFLSGHNYANQGQQVAEVSRDTVATFVDRYCLEHSRATVFEAAMRMSDRYSGRNTPISR